MRQYYVEMHDKQRKTEKKKKLINRNAHLYISLRSSEETGIVTKWQLEIIFVFLQKTNNNLNMMRYNALKQRLKTEYNIYKPHNSIL